MADHNQPDLRLSMNPVALSSYAVAICSFGGALIGLVSSHFPSGGLAAVGGFYLVVGLLSRSPAHSRAGQIDQLNGHTSGADNLVAEAVATGRDTTTTAGHSRELASAVR